ncbi:LEM domain-containing protein 1 isoform X7 [Xyrichtys novacula]|uniref:LEM domain-containing protein 1 isoform X7 n=1 Tax=Xyrichtys novacula TaxID=13765 RepID=A0AAV1HI39_XYRNO|nr:LEM domain-containing protein 1 isoform X7 [Xyrichtys novacula]
MPLFEEDPAHLSKARLKSDLIAHNVALPPTKSKKEVYVELHSKHIDLKHAGDFSSDEEDQVQDVEDKDPEDAGIPDPRDLTDDDLKAALLKHGFKPGPIVGTTRALYEKKLRALLQSDGHSALNGTEKGVLYSDSEEEEENEEDQDRESESEGEQEETVEQSEQAQQESVPVKTYFQKGGFVYPQCFLPSSRLRAQASRNREPAPKWNSGNALKTSERSQSQCSQIPAGISRASSVDQLSGLGSGLPHEPLKESYKDMFPDAVTTPTGIYASCRKPIKGAAGRPIQFAYPDTPLSPTTLERQEVERRLVPIQIQLVVFLIVACLLYLIYVSAEDNSFSPILALLDSLSDEERSLQAETQDTAPLSGQE